MSRLPLLVCCLSVVGVSASGVPVADRCQQVASTFSQLGSKVQGCVGAADAQMPVDLASCRATTDHCSPADQRSIDQFLGCVARLPNCEAGELSGWRSQYEACAAGIQLAPGCSL